MENVLFEKTPVPKAYMKLALPVVFSMMVSLIYNMVDTYFIALTGVQELVAGVSLVVPVFTLMIAFGDIFGLGGSSLISRLFGEKRLEEAKRVSAFCIWGAIGFGIFVSIVLMVFKTPILHILGTDDGTFQYASDYYTWIAIGATSIIFGLKQGAAGAAIATVLGNLIADIYYLYVMIKKTNRLSVSIGDAKISTSMIRNVLIIGILASITNIMQSFMVMTTNHYLLPYGNDKIAAMGIALKVNMITALILVGFAFGGQPLIGYNYGSKNNKRLKEILKFAYLFEMGLGLVFTIIMSVFAPLIISVFMKQSDIVSNGATMLRFQQLGMTFMAVTLVSTCVCQSVGSALGAFILSISRQGVVYVLALVVMSNVVGYNGILVSQACSDVITAVIAISIIFKIINKK